MTGRRNVARVCATATGVGASCALGVVTLAALPSMAGVAVLLGATVVIVVLAAGRWEVPATRVLTAAREPRPEELAVLGPAVRLLTVAGLLGSPVEVLILGHHEGVWVRAAGRRTVLVSRGMVGAAAPGGLPAQESAALLAHAIGRLRLGQTRFEVALEVALLPWRTVRAVAAGVGRVMGRLPLVRLAWRLRVVTGVVAVFQGVTVGPLLPGVAAGLVVALSYPLPWWEIRADQQAEADADNLVVAAGFGTALAGFLAREHQTPHTAARIHRLTAATAAGQQLALVC